RSPAFTTNRQIPVLSSMKVHDSVCAAYAMSGGSSMGADRWVVTCGELAFPEGGSPHRAIKQCPHRRLQWRRTDVPRVRGAYFLGDLPLPCGAPAARSRVP